MNDRLTTSPFLRSLCVIAPIIPLGLATAVKLCILVKRGKYAWDTDHMMYYGQRLLAGELVWTHEYDDKLPLLQLAFAGPAYFGSVEVWKVISVAVILATGWFFRLGVAELLRQSWNIERIDAKLAATWGGVFYVAFMVQTSANIGHINAMAASLFTLGMLLYLGEHGCAPDRSSKPRRRPLLISATLTAAAISIRPYYLLCSLILPLWSHARRRSALVLGRIAAWGATLGALGIFLNATHFLCSGNVSSFVAGLQIMQQSTTPMTIAENVLAQVKSINGSSLYFAGSVFHVVLICFLFRGARVAALAHRRMEWRVDIVFGCIVAPLLLEMMVLSKHYWPHYIELFAPFLALSVSFVIAGLLCSGGMTTVRHGFMFSCVTTILMLTQVRSGVLADLRSMADESPSHFHQPDLEAVEECLEACGKPRPAFLYPMSMYVHWKLEEARHGFPHASNSDHIVQRNWWRNVHVPDELQIPTTAEEYCDMLNSVGPPVLFAQDDQFIIRLEACGLEYTRRREVNLTNGRSLLVYVKDGHLNQRLAGDVHAR